MEITREFCWKLVTEWTKAPHLRNHMLAVETAINLEQPNGGSYNENQS